ncbi:MAG: branched-chain amino acid ABC transporter permease [Spirochaetes bacterium]|nr:branched-chain amino acid ABC transporter permease [Spirochaetota bacterium]
MFIQTIITGLSIGSVYALMAVGYSLVFSVLNFSNFAHGAIITMGAYIAWALMVHYMHVPFFPALLLSMGGAGILAFLNERIAYSTLRRRRAPSLFLMISAMGVAISLQNLLYATIGAKLYALPPVFAMDVLHIGELTISKMDIFAFLFSAFTIAILHLILIRTKVGMAIRAAAHDMEMVSVLGVNLDVLVGVLFFIAGSLGGMAGVFMGVKYMVYPSMGWITNKAYIGAVIGGLGSLPGAIVGGLLLGLLEALVSVSSVGGTSLSTYRDVFSFGILVVLLIFKPTGFFGRHVEDKL